MKRVRRPATPFRPAATNISGCFSCTARKQTEEFCFLFLRLMFLTWSADDDIARAEAAIAGMGQSVEAMSSGDLSMSEQPEMDDEDEEEQDGEEDAEERALMMRLVRARAERIIEAAQKGAFGASLSPTTFQSRCGHVFVCSWVNLAVQQSRAEGWRR